MRQSRASGDGTYTSIAFGLRCREAGVRPSMGSVGDAYDNALCESFFATLECELLDRQRERVPRHFHAGRRQSPADHRLYRGAEPGRSDLPRTSVPSNSAFVPSML